MGLIPRIFSDKRATGAAVVLGVPTSMIRLHTANGYGSSSTTIRKFSTLISSVGTGITYTTAADPSVLGSVFTINENGIYTISYNDVFNASGVVGVSLNSSQLTTSVMSITTADALIFGSTAAADVAACAAWTGRLVAGDVIRPHTNGIGASSSPDRCRFTIAQVVRF